MKTINDYISLPYRMQIVEDATEGNVVSLPELSGCITSGDTMESAFTNAVGAKRKGLSMNQYCLYLLAQNDTLYMSRKGVNA